MRLQRHGEAGRSTVASVYTPYPDGRRAGVRVARRALMRTPATDEERHVTMDHVHPVDPDAVAKARAHALSAADADRVTAVLAVLADPLVVRLVAALDEDEGTSAAELTLVLGVASETVESTLGRLSDNGIVRNDQCGGPRRYRLASAGLAHIVTLLSSTP